MLPSDHLLSYVDIPVYGVIHIGLSHICDHIPVYKDFFHIEDENIILIDGNTEITQRYQETYPSLRIHTDFIWNRNEDFVPLYRCSSDISKSQCSLLEHRFRNHVIDMVNVKTLPVFLKNNLIDTHNYNLLTIDVRNLSLDILRESVQLFPFFDYIYIYYDDDPYVLDIDAFLSSHSYRRLLTALKQQIPQGEAFYGRLNTGIVHSSSLSMSLSASLCNLIQILNDADEKNQSLYFVDDIFPNVCKTRHHIFRPGYGFKSIPEKNTFQNIINQSWQKHHINIFQDVHMNPNKILSWINETGSKYLARILRDSTPKPFISNNNLVIYISTNDEDYLKKTTCPLDYYAYIIDHTDYNTITLLTNQESASSHIITKLKKRFPQIKTTIATPRQELDTLMSARHVILGDGILGYLFLIMSSNISRIYCYSEQSYDFTNNPGSSRIIYIGQDNDLDEMTVIDKK